MSWQLLTAVLVLLTSTITLLQRVLMSRDRIHPVTYVTLFQAFTGLFASLIALVHGWKWPDFGRFWLPMFVSSSCYTLGHLLYSRVLQVKPAAHGAVLWTIAAVWTVLLSALFLHERFTSANMVGMLLVFSGVMILTVSRGSFGLDRASLLGYLATVFFGVGAISWGYVARFSDAYTWAAVSFLGQVIFFLIIRPSAVRLVQHFSWWRSGPKILLLAFLYSITASVTLLAFQRGGIGLVTAVARLDVVVTVVLAALVLGERSHLGKKLFASALCAVGAALLG